MTVYVTKYLKTRGIVPAELLEIVQKPQMKAAVKFFSGDYAIVGHEEWHLTHEAAQRHAEQVALGIK